uniref:uncharacterized protein LOC129502195 n=1 Tax=Nyctereutes procyonoides TaxID=34880 RepID=UPI002443DEDD|nr:uncharacterized protein LOC129502195 [Nyctereutes procyonoides]XP_055169682.1 uncharacterized protein LOC129502195 [Nyctereutes procyonoides]
MAGLQRRRVAVPAGRAACAEVCRGVLARQREPLPAPQRPGVTWCPPGPAQALPGLAVDSRPGGVSPGGSPGAAPPAPWPRLAPRFTSFTRRSHSLHCAARSGRWSWCLHPKGNLPVSGHLHPPQPVSCFSSVDLPVVDVAHIRTRRPRKTHSASTRSSGRGCRSAGIWVLLLCGRGAVVLGHPCTSVRVDPLPGLRTGRRGGIAGPSRSSVWTPVTEEEPPWATAAALSCVPCGAVWGCPGTAVPRGAKGRLPWFGCAFSNTDGTERLPVCPWAPTHALWERPFGWFVCTCATVRALECGWKWPGWQGHWDRVPLTGGFSAHPAPGAPGWKGLWLVRVPVSSHGHTSVRLLPGSEGGGQTPEAAH